MRQRLCRLDELPDPGSREFELDKGHAVFVVRKDERIFAYENSCPHTGVSLNWLPDRFLDGDGAFIQCDMHGARFRIEDGACVFGPCAGKGLKPVSVLIDGQQIVVDLDG